MALTITETKRTVIGNLRYVTFDISDDDGTGGTVDTGLVEIVALSIVNTTAVAREPLITKAAGIVTIGGEGNAADTYSLSVAGW